MNNKCTLITPKQAVIAATYCPDSAFQHHTGCVGNW